MLRGRCCAASSALCLLLCLVHAAAVPMERRRLETDAAAAAAEEEGESAAAVATTDGEETPDEQLARLKEVIQGKQGKLKDFVLANGIDNRTYILAEQEEIQGLMKQYKEIAAANAPPPPPPPYQDGLGECVDGDCEEGEGVYEWEDGGRYEGGFSNSSKTGHGMYIHPESGMYNGTWKFGRPDGEGVFVAKDNQWNYTGAYKEGMMNGKGTYIFERCRWAMEEQYREHYCANKNRIVLYRGTASYKGSLSECATLAQKNPGCGHTLYYAGSSTAPTSDCVCVGKGEECKPKPSAKINHVYKYACEGGKLDGHFTKGAPDGPGTWTGADGTSYSGNYTMGEMSGGVYTWKDGGKFDGRWIGQQPNWPNGTYTGSDGKIYEDRSEDAKNIQAAHEKMLEETEEIEEEELAREQSDAPDDDAINAIFITFLNKASRQVDLFWKGQDEETFMAALKPSGDGYRVKSYLGHQWVIKFNGVQVKEMTVNMLAEGQEQNFVVEDSDIREKPKSPQTTKTKIVGSGNKEDLRRRALMMSTVGTDLPFFGWAQGEWMRVDERWPWQVEDIVGVAWLVTV
eukprot:COSAG01_NODE_2394_length_7772_cov_153.097615_1_plen_571_part_00